MINISESVWTEIKVLATRRGKGYSEFVEEILSEYIAHIEAHSAA